MLPGDSAELRKARGAFFTPVAVARFIADWAIQSPEDAVLEPSCGEAVFLHEAGREGGHTGPLVGVELHASSAAESERTLRAEGIKADIHVGDFFRHDEFGCYDAVIGNPPYVRYQDFAGEPRARAQAAALRGGVSLTKLASSWAAFTVHSALHLKRGGRLGLVLPAELLAVNYAGGVRRFLLDHFSHVGLVLFEERVFPGVLEEVVLLLAAGYDPDGLDGTDDVTVRRLRNTAGLAHLMSGGRRWRPPAKSAKWFAALMSAGGLAAYDQLVTGAGFTHLESWGDTTLGMVTGNNGFFTLSPATVAELGLEPADVIPLSPPGSRHLRALTLTREALSQLGEAGSATYLFRPAGEPSRAGWRYIKLGAEMSVPSAYKCRVRDPWWRVPYLRPADLFLTYMNADTPRFASNQARAHHLNSVHGVYLHDDVRANGVDLLPLAALNSATLLAAETVGRAYGGGMLKIEPREADLLPVPSIALLAAQKEALAGLRQQVTTHLRAGRLASAVALVDDILLTRGLGLDRAALAAIRADHADLTGRRITRGREASRGG